MTRAKAGALRAAAAAALLAALAGCDSAAPPRQASSTTVAAAPAPACEKLPEGSLPHSAGMLTEQQTGAYCLPRGQRLDVFLTATKGSQWRPVHASGAGGVLAPANTGVMTAPLGVTPAMFVGATDGTATLSSATASGAATWTVTVVVEG
ncbi:hypothetical protein [Streptacidiphilus rugosus]|uniref:hypothetical protein n=1 Tax=Streptacidiphilus rugosus TaxID=405783 RepID=UPI0012FC3893|nr:hypothetical protein [Streptacidiphilus rugosus]